MFSLSDGEALFLTVKNKFEEDEKSKFADFCSLDSALRPLNSLHIQYFTASLYIRDIRWKRQGIESNQEILKRIHVLFKSDS